MVCLPGVVLFVQIEGHREYVRRPTEHLKEGFGRLQPVGFTFMTVYFV